MEMDGFDQSVWPSLCETRIVDYAIPKTRVEQARERDAKYNSMSAATALYNEALHTFTDLEKTGEGGELLLYLLAERFLGLPQVLCKMDLKTDSRMHYHGADGVYASVRQDGVLKLFWGESKVYADATTAVRDCLKSLAPFLLEPDNEDSSRERDLVLLSDKADLNDPNLTAAFRKYFDKTSPFSNRVEYCGVALIGFDASFYPPDSQKAVAAQLVVAAKQELEKWKIRVSSRISSEKLEQFDIQFFCVPIPSADGFREAFPQCTGAELMGHEELCDWLIEEALRDDIIQIVQLTVAAELSNLKSSSADEALIARN